MRNQIAAAERIGIRAETINSTNTDDWPRVERRRLANQVDLLLVSPERLGNESFRDDLLIPIAGRVGLFVVDEAHCISDWGHDFRPDYRRIVKVLQVLPPGPSGSSFDRLKPSSSRSDRVVRPAPFG
jgi:ATP-dependent DNA helicase RecQ